MVIRYLPNVENELSHHGIKGQKWGIRRFQNKDGSLTNKGKKRYVLSYKDRMERKINRDFEKNKAEGITKDKSESAEMTIRKESRKIGFQSVLRMVIPPVLVATGSAAVAAMTSNPIWLLGIAAAPVTGAAINAAGFAVDAYKNMKLGDLQDKYGVPDSKKVRLT